MMPSRPGTPPVLVGVCDWEEAPPPACRARLVLEVALAILLAVVNAKGRVRVGSTSADVSVWEITISSPNRSLVHFPHVTYRASS